MKLVIAEKPSVARDLARVLGARSSQTGYLEGNGYWVTWALGHLVQLCQPEQYGGQFKQWQMNALPIIPEEFKKEVRPDQGAKRQYEAIVTLLRRAELTDVICATDAGREGELIFRLIYESAGVSVPIHRLWISSQTDAAIQEGFANLKTGAEMQSLYDCARSRSEADWLVGINATRAYTIRFSRGEGVMSVGRVQTPVLNLICKRYLEHSQFVPQDYGEIWARFRHPKGEYVGQWFKDKWDRFSDLKAAETLVESLKTEKTGLVVGVEKTKRNEVPPLLYDLTELQKDCNRRFKLSAERTLGIAQALYESHKIITYPRTSSRYLSADLKPKLEKLLGLLQKCPDYEAYATPLLSKKLTVGKRVIDDKKVTDHHAIILTDKMPDLARLSQEERQVFDLIARRFLSVFYPNCEKSLTEIVTQVASETFRTSGMVVDKPGWRVVYGSDDADTEETLPAVKQGDAVEAGDFEMKKKKTKAPALYTEASILAAMETAGRDIEDEALREAMKDCGLGTPATRAQIIERLIYVNYVVRDQQRLVPTEKGLKIIANIRNQALLSPELTGDWEKKLNDIYKKKYSRDAYMAEIQAFTQQIVQEVAQLASGVPVGVCPLCSGQVRDYPKSWSCAEWKTKGCGFVIWKQVAGKEIDKNVLMLLLEKKESELIEGFKSKAGKDFKAKLVLNTEGKVVFKFV